jgi:hypothetical protein
MPTCARGLRNETSFQAPSDVGFTIPAGAGTYWMGQAMGDAVRQAGAGDAHAANAAHLAGLLKEERYPGLPD